MFSVFLFALVSAYTDKYDYLVQTFGLAWFGGMVFIPVGFVVRSKEFSPVTVTLLFAVLFVTSIFLVALGRWLGKQFLKYRAV